MRLPIRVTKKRLLVAAMVASLVTSVLGDAVGVRLRNLVQPILSPLGDAGMYLTLALRRNISARQKELSPQEIRELKGKFLELRGYAVYWMHEAEKYKQQLDEVLRFQQSYGPASDLPCGLIPARVVGEPALPYTQGRSLNLGSADGLGRGEVVLSHNRSKALPPGLAAVTGSALVGRISSAGAFSAQLQLITDAQFKTAARIRRVLDADHPREIRVLAEGAASLQILSESNNRPIDVQAAGDGKGGMMITDVWRYDSVQPGDVVVRREDAFLPLEVKIGLVSEVRPDPMHRDRMLVSVRPEADLGELRDVLIVLPPSSWRASDGR